MESPSTAVLLLAYGGPERLEDVEAFLLDIRGGRPTSPELVEEIRSRYAAIGGRSPLLDITRAQARALEARLRQGGADATAYVGMRHWTPFIRDTVAEVAAAGHHRLVAVCMAPHYSKLSIGAYRKKLDEAVASLSGMPGKTAASFSRVSFVDSWHDHPRFLEALEMRVRDALARFPEGARPTVLFTAHSLPERILEEGDPYADQVAETARLIAGRFDGLDWLQCWQSAGAAGGKWLGPPLEEVVAELAREGKKDLLVCPVGFVCDHVEVLFDVDVEAREIAEAHGARLERTESLNDDPLLIEALAELVRRAVRGTS
jgi:protoporphyrin/coproporphyrin ferrochelatase